MPKFLIREATENDAPGLVRYLHALRENDDHPGVLPMHASPTEARQRQWVEEYRVGKGYILLLCDGERVLGCAELTRGIGPHRLHCVSLGVSLVKEARGQGYGTALMHALHRWAEDQPDIDRIQLEVFHTNPGAIRLYERMGYVYEGRRIGAYKRDGQPIDAIQMARLIGGSEWPTVSDSARPSE